MLRVGNENTCVTVNWISAALKVTAGYIPAVTVDFCSFDKKQRKCMPFYFTLGYSISLVGC